MLENADFNAMYMATALSGAESGSENGSWALSIRNKITLGIGGSASFWFVQAVDFDWDDIQKDMKDLPQGQKGVDRVFESNRMRWNGYLDKVLIAELGQKQKEILGSSIATLIYNWRSPAGDILHDGCFPSVHQFRAFWAWDSWKHDAALSLFAPELGRNQIRAMFDYQRDDGMVPDTVCFNKKNNNWLNSKPPLAAWAVWNLERHESDEKFLQEIYPKLVRYHEWWYMDRLPPGEALCAWGSAGEYPYAAAWESGLDNSIRFDEVKLIKLHEGTYIQDILALDLNAYLYTDKVYLAKIAEKLGLKGDAQKWSGEAEKLAAEISKVMFDPEEGAFFDVRIQGQSFVKTYSVVQWLPLWAGIADEEEAIRMIGHMLDPEKFWTNMPFPTVAIDDPEFDSGGYWRGPVWLDHAYFGIVALKRYGYESSAEEAVERLFQVDGIWENYDPFTGKGQGEHQFGWTAAAYIMMSEFWW